MLFSVSLCLCGRVLCSIIRILVGGDFDAIALFLYAFTLDRQSKIGYIRLHHSATSTKHHGRIAVTHHEATSQNPDPAAHLLRHGTGLIACMAVFIAGRVRFSCRQRERHSDASAFCCREIQIRSRLYRRELAGLFQRAGRRRGPCGLCRRHRYAAGQRDRCQPAHIGHRSLPTE